MQFIIDFNIIKEYISEILWKIIIIAIIIGMTFLIVKIIQKLLENSIKKSYLKIGSTQYTILKRVITVLVYIIGISIAIYTVPSFRTLAVSIFAGAGVLALIIGFASQQAFANIVSGIFIAIFEPFRVGNWIKLQNGTAGTVEDITLRHTVIKTVDKRRVIVPNTVISNEIIENATNHDHTTCQSIDMNISYDANVEKAMKIMQEEAMKHPDFCDVRTKEEKEKNKPAVDVKVISFGESSVNVRAWTWTKDPLVAVRMGYDLNKSIKVRFDKEGIEIPYPYRTVVFKKEQKKRKK